MIIGHDRKCGQGGCCGRHGGFIPFPHNRSSTWGQLEWGNSSGSPYETTSEEDHRTWSFRGLVPSLFSASHSLPPADTLAPTVQIIERIKHSTAVIPGLPTPLREAAVGSYADGLKVVFICQIVWSVLAFVCCLSIEERPLPYVCHLLAPDLTVAQWDCLFLGPRWRNRRGCIETDKTGKTKVLNGTNWVPDGFWYVRTFGKVYLSERTRRMSWVWMPADQ